MTRRATLPLPVLLERHRAELSACRLCGHADGVLPILSDAPAPRVMLVGQAPGKTETTSRRPFMGRAGRTLFRWFERAGLPETEARECIYFAAVTRCYPGPHPGGRGDRVPSPLERERCRTWLVRELRIVRPALIILVGRLAMDETMGRAAASTPLDRLVGRVHELEHEGGRSRVVPLPHPSGASSWLNRPENTRLLDRALELLRVELASAGALAGPVRRAG